MIRDQNAALYQIYKQRCIASKGYALIYIMAWDPYETN